VAGCSGTDDSTVSNVVCGASVTGSGRSNTAGTLVVDGSFPLSILTVVARYTAGGTQQEVAGVKNDAMTSVTFSSLPSGFNTFSIYVKCDAGQQLVSTIPIQIL
jgi:hypothetical protein